MEKAIYEMTETETMEAGEVIQITTRLKINWGHDIFTGHFPGNPVLPGVVQIRIITDVINKVFKKDLALSNASNIKFINMVVPENASDLSLGLDAKPTGAGNYAVTAMLNNQQLTFLKLKGVFSPVERLCNRTNS